MKKLLYIINGLGLGNSTRCSSIMHYHDKNQCVVDVLTSGNGIGFFKNKSGVNKLFFFKGLNYGKGKDGKLSIRGTLFNAWREVLVFFSNAIYLRKKLIDGKYDVIVIDSDYTLLLLKFFVKVPIVAINHASIIVHECQQLSQIPASIRSQLMIERADNWYHRIIPNHVLSPSIECCKADEKKTFYAPFIRHDLMRKKGVSKVKSILVMLSGSTFGSSVDFVSDINLADYMRIDVIGRDGVSSDQVQFHGKMMNNKMLINNCDLMVINGGFSAVSEAVVLQKPCVVIPIENHAEQYINGEIVVRNGLGVVANLVNVVDKVQQVIDEYQSFIETHKRFNCSLEGAYLAAKKLESFVS